MPEIRTEIEIDAEPEAVWRIVADFAAYPEWNPFVTSIEGPQEVGARLNVYLDPPNGRGMGFKPTVRAFDEGRELRWLGRLGLPGIFDGEHSFRVEARDGGGTTFVHQERFSGVLSIPMMWFLRKNTTRGFEAMNAALKERAEAAGSC